MATTFTKDPTTGEYVVRTGDSLSKIASSQGRTLADLLSVNPEYASHPNLIQPGNVIKPSLFSLPGMSAPASSKTPTSTGTNPVPFLPTQTPAQQPKMSFSQALTQMLKDAQQAQQVGTANLLKQKQGITTTGLNQAANVSNITDLTPQGRIALRDSAISAVNPGELSVNNQIQLANKGASDVKDLIGQASDNYQKEQDRIEQAAQRAADEAYKKTVLAETIRHNKAQEGIDSQKTKATTNNIFGSAKLTTGQKNDLADMLVLQKQISALNNMKDKYGGYIGAGPLSGLVNQPLASITGNVREGAQDIRNNIGQIKGFIAKLRGGTSFTPNEQRLLDTYTPRIGDSDTVIDSKLKSLDQYINDKIESTVLVSGGDYSAPGEIVTGPDGQTYQITN